MITVQVLPLDAEAVVSKFGISSKSLVNEGDSFVSGYCTVVLPSIRRRLSDVSVESDRSLPTDCVSDHTGILTVPGPVVAVEISRNGIVPVEILRKSSAARLHSRRQIKNLILILIVTKVGARMSNGVIRWV